MILASDLYKDDGTIDLGISKLIEFRKEYKTFIQEIKRDAATIELKIEGTSPASLSGQKTLNEEAKAVAALEKTYNQYVQQLDDVNIKIEALKSAKSELRKAQSLEAKANASQGGSLKNLQAQYKLNKIRLDQMSEAQKQSTREGFELSEQTERLEKRIKDQKAEAREAIKVRQLEDQATQAAAGSHAQLSAQYRLNIRRIKELSAEERDSTAAGKALVAETKALNDQLKAIEKSYGSTSRNVGNYTDSIVAAFNSQTRLARELQEAKDVFAKLPAEIRESSKAQKEFAATTERISSQIDQLSEITGQSAEDIEALTDEGLRFIDQMGDAPGVLGNVAGGLKGVSGAAKALLANPLVLFVTALVGGLTLLGKLFFSTERGANVLAKATGLFNGIVSEAVGLVDGFVDSLSSIADDPLEAFKSLGTGIVDNVLNRLKVIPSFAKLVGQSFKQLKNGDIEGLKGSAKEAGQLLVQAVTGFDTEQQDGIVNYLKQTNEQIDGTIARFTALEVRQREVRKANRETERELQSLIAAEEQYRAIADDTTRSFAVREAAAVKAQQNSEARARREIVIARRSLGLLNEELALRRSNGEDVEDLADRQLQAFTELANAERELTRVTQENDRQRRELTQDRLERDLDFLIDGFDNQKTINERKIKDESLSEDARRKLLQETKQQFEDSFAAQIGIIEQFAGASIDANDLIQTSDARLLAEKARALGLSEIIEGRLLEIIRDRRTGVQDLAEAEIELNKALSDRSEIKIAELDTVVENQVDRIKKIVKDLEFVEVDIDGKSLSERLGLGEEDLDDVKLSVGKAKEFLAGLADARVQAADRAVNATNAEVSTSEAALQREIELRDQGFASNVEAANRALEEDKKRQAEALEDQRKAQRAQILLDGALQASNLVTASTQIWKQVGFPLAIPAIALMFGTFLSTKAKALRATKEIRREGGIDHIGGGSHESGNDTYLGYQVQGRPVFAEKGETHVTFTPRVSKKYRKEIPAVYDLMKGGNFAMDMLGGTQVLNYQPNEWQSVTDMSGTEKELKAIRKQGEIKRYRNSKGQLVVEQKGIKTTYV